MHPDIYVRKTTKKDDKEKKIDIKEQGDYIRRINALIGYHLHINTNTIKDLDEWLDLRTQVLYILNLKNRE